MRYIKIVGLLLFFILTACMPKSRLTRECSSDEVIVDGECKSIESCRTSSPESFCSDLTPLISYRNQVSDLELSISEPSQGDGLIVYNILAKPYSHEFCFELEFLPQVLLTDHFYVIRVKGPDGHSDSVLNLSTSSDIKNVSYCYNRVTTSKTYTVEFGYVSLTQVSGNADFNVVERFRFSIPSLEERAEISATGGVIHHQISEDLNTYHELDHTLIINDPEEALSSFDVVVVSATYDSIVSTIPFEDVSTYRKGEDIIVEHLIIDGLTPDESYYVVVNASYFDGVDTFVDAQIHSEELRTDRPHGLYISAHGLYGYITDYHVENDQLCLFLKWEISDDYVDSEGNPVTADIVFFNHQTEVYRFSLEEDIDYVEIPIDMIATSTRVSLLSSVSLNGKPSGYTLTGIFLNLD